MGMIHLHILYPRARACVFWSQESIEQNICIPVLM